MFCVTFSQETGVEVQQKVAKWMSKMVATRADIVRAVPTHRALQQLGYIFWTRHVKPEWYDLSHVTDSIGEFWSHSWQLTPWFKILTLLFFKNGIPAVIAGVLAAGVACILCVLRVLPVGPAAEQNVHSAGSTLWCTCLGWGFYILVLLGWRPRRTIFLDRICIHQSDPDLMQEGLLSVGAFLRMSDKMLVLWDKTYVHRLWCMLEVAAFLKSREHGDLPSMTIVPTHLGPFCFVLNLAVGIVYVAAWIFLMRGIYAWTLLVILPLFMIPTGHFLISNAREYVRDVQAMREQLATFSLVDARCSCCDKNHITRSGKRIICDRVVIEQCIVEWFESKDDFNEAVRLTVLPAFAKRFGQNEIPLWIFLIATAPTCWILLDVVAGYAVAEQELGEGSSSRWWLLLCCGMWLGTQSAGCSWVLFLSRKLSKDRGRVLGFGVNMLILASVVPVLCGGVALHLLTAEEYAGSLSPWLGIASATFQILIGFVAWQGCARRCSSECKPC
ncbi:unnamed protein product [Effrenium voratum]|nr:unnamed protein product [Effrenium voratum]